MADPIRPSKEDFTRVVQQSYALWSSYLTTAAETPSLPRSCIDLKQLITNTPSFLGHGLFRGNEHISLDCTKKSYDDGQGSLVLNGYASWKTSTWTGVCQLGPKRIPLQLLLGFHGPLQIQFSDDDDVLSSAWPDIDGLSGSDKGNCIAVFFLAWAYILSAKWAELLSKSPEHVCNIAMSTQSSSSVSASRRDQRVEIDMGSNLDHDEAHWWNAILSSHESWKITTDYKGKTYHAPWSVSVTGGRECFVSKKNRNSEDIKQPPSSDTAFGYLTRLCAYNKLYDQCLAALSAALYIPFLNGNGKVVLLPVPRNPINLGDHPPPSVIMSSSHESLLIEQKIYLSHYMTLSCNTWGIRSLLCSTFYNPDIECNLVSAWLNPALALIEPLVKNEDYSRLLKMLAIRQPQLAPLWLGAILTGIAKSILLDVRNGLLAINLHAAAWSGTVQSFVTLEPGACNEEFIRREDECRLLFLTGCGGSQHGSVPFSPWKPFGENRVCDTEVEVQQHIKCGNEHRLEYEYWHWGFVNGRELHDTGSKLIAVQDTTTSEQSTFSPSSSSLTNCPFDCSSESLSEGATRGIFGWLRSGGYPACEKPIYEHAWFDIGISSEDDLDPDPDSDSDAVNTISKPGNIKDWLETTTSNC